MKTPAFALLALFATACDFDDNALLEPLPDSSTCDAPLEMNALASLQPDGSVQIIGGVHARDGVTVRALYVANTLVPRIDFNYRSWTLNVPVGTVNAATHAGVATLSVIAYSSMGCARMSPPLTVIITSSADAGHGDAGDASPDDGGRGDAGDAGDAGDVGDADASDATDAAKSPVVDAKAPDSGGNHGSVDASGD